jgi:preprotein translocase subunit SecA
LLNDPNFLKLSDVEILRTLRENDKIVIPRYSYQCSIKYLINELQAYYKKHQQQENQIVKNLGGLYIFGTERNDSRRVDNQLRGRCGRQGDPGTSQFFLSLDDTLLRLFGGPKIQTFLQAQMIDDAPLESKMLTKSLNLAQQRVEERAYQQRKNLFDYDEILNKQRQIIYADRKGILENQALEKIMLGFGEQILTDIVLDLNKEKLSPNEMVLLFENLSSKNLILNYNDFDGLKRYLFTEFWLLYQARKSEFDVYGPFICRKFEQGIILVNIDQSWREHLQKITLLRDAVSWRGYGQQNPLYEYKREAFRTFSEQVKTLRQLIIYDFLRSYIL